jgi:hypothetical protein
MRLWTLHPQYLDAKGLVAAWREALLAQKVLAGATVGYRAHPQLWRFRQAAHPMQAIADFLHGLHDEAEARGYRFDASKIGMPRSAAQLPATTGQLLYEWEHLLGKVQVRAPEHYRALATVRDPQPHPLFALIEGEVEVWEVRPST